MCFLFHLHSWWIFQRAICWTTSRQGLGLNPYFPGATEKKSGPGDRSSKPIESSFQRLEAMSEIMAQAEVEARDFVEQKARQHAIRMFNMACAGAFRCVG